MGLVSADAASRLGLAAGELHNQAQLALSEEWLDATHDPRPAADRYMLTNLERLLTAEMAGRDYLLPVT